MSEDCRKCTIVKIIIAFIIVAIALFLIISALHGTTLKTLSTTFKSHPAGSTPSNPTGKKSG